jgi:hypothetical protein
MVNTHGKGRKSNSGNHPNHNTAPIEKGGETMADAKPVKKMKPNTDAKPNVKTFVRCNECGSKFVMEEEGSCPKGCKPTKKSSKKKSSA